MSSLAFAFLLISVLHPSTFQADPPGSRPSDPASPRAGPLEVTVPHYNNTSCPIMGKPISTKLFAETEKGRIYICCKSCIKDILEDVETAHRTAYPVVKKLGNAKCPVSGKPIEKDSPTTVLQGFEASVCCKDCPPKLRANAQIYFTRMLRPEVVDLENKVCPITGEAVSPNAYCLIGDSLVRLSSVRCVDEVILDPAKALQRAKELRAKEQAQEPKLGERRG